MQGNVIAKLSSILEKKGNRKKIDAYEDVIVESIDEYIEDEAFFSLPTKEITNIIKKCSFDSIDTINKIISSMIESKGDESTLILNAIDFDEATFEDCINIISKFEHSPFCQKTNDLFKESKNLAERDYDFEIKELNIEIDKLNERNKKLKQEIYILKKKDDAPPKVPKLTTEDASTKIPKQAIAEPRSKIPRVSRIPKPKVKTPEIPRLASEHGVETKDKDGNTPLNQASIHGDLEMVKYQIEKCNAKFETKNYDGSTPLNNAAFNGHLDIVQYLCEKCHANVETKDIIGRTPLYWAANNGYFEIVKYLRDQCHAKVPNSAIVVAKTDEIKEYLRSRKSLHLY